MTSQAPPAAMSPLLRRRKTPPVTTTTSAAAAAAAAAAVGSVSPTRSAAILNPGFSVFRHKRSDSPEDVAALTSPPTPKSANKRNVTERLQRLRRKLNPRPNAARWRYRLSTNQQNFSSEELGDDLGFGNEDDDDSAIEALLNEAQLPGIVENGDNWETTSSSRWSPTPPAPPSNDSKAGPSRPQAFGATGRSVSFDLSSLEPPPAKPLIAVGIQSPSSSWPLQLKANVEHNHTPLHHSVSPNLRRFGSDRKEFRVRPFSCFSEPIYMTEAEIYHNMLQQPQCVQFVESYMKPSVAQLKTPVPPYIEQHYSSPQVDGRIGSLRVEVLGCVGLSPVKPDIAVYLICGDSAFCTDVITSCRSPMWPNLSRRAAVFALHHGYARLYVGAFDVRAVARKHSKEKDDFCGRVVVDIATLRPGTEYDVTFPLRVSSFIYDRKPRGVIRLRFSLHWFSERYAILSYWRSPQCTSSSLANQQPTIPCADPKTFRNVAVTMYGRDLPGKYSRKAFRATMREFNLYQQNLRHWVKMMLVDIVFYEKPTMSLYLFMAWMHCIQANAVRLVPAYFIGYLIYLFCDSYMRYNESAKANLGYSPVTLKEVLRALVNLKHGNRKAKSKKASSKLPPASCFYPLLVRKKPKKNRYMKPAPPPRGLTLIGTPSSIKENNGEKPANSEFGGDDDYDIEPMNHREFPFSERHEYTKFSVDDALASTVHRNQVNGTGSKDHHRLAGRLSIYVQQSDQKQETENQSSCDDDDSSEMSDPVEQEDETVMTEGDMGVFDDSDTEEEDEASNPISAETVTLNVSTRDSRRICPGPPQNNDVMPLKRIPPQVHLARIEGNLHRLSLGLANELVQVPMKWVDEASPLDADSDVHAEQNDTQSSGSKKKKRKLHWDDFDKVLGLRERHQNPVLRITSAFLGPLMRMLRIFIYAVRVSFNVTTWRDPFLSFWVLATLILLFFILLVFPWRAFLFIVGWACLGPQNILVRRYLEKRVAEAEAKAKDNEAESEPAAIPIIQQSPEQQPLSDENNDKTEQKAGARRGLQSRLARLKEKRDEKRRAKRGESPSVGADGSPEVNEAANAVIRPAFSTQFNGKQVKKGTQPREIVVPYSRLRKERFYDWPPDPTVSRATPISLVSSTTSSTTANNFDNSFSDLSQAPQQRDKSRRPNDRRTMPSTDSAHARRQATFGDISPFVKMPSDGDNATVSTSRSSTTVRQHFSQD